MMVDRRRSLRRIRSAAVVVLVVRVVRVMVHGVGGRAAVHATAAGPVVAGRRRIVSRGGGCGGPRAVRSPCGIKNHGKNQMDEKIAANGVVACGKYGRGAFGVGLETDVGVM